MKKNHYLLLFILVLLSVTIFFIWRSPKQRELPNKPTVLPEKIIVGTSADYKPFTFLAAEDQFAGFDIDVVREVGRRINKEIEFRDIPFTALIPEIQLGKIHMIAAGIDSTPERANRVLFTQPHHEGAPLVIVSLQETGPFASTEDLAGKRVIVNTGFVSEQILTNRTNIDLLRLPTVVEAFLALQNKQADAFFSGQAAFIPFLKKHGSAQYHISSTPEIRESVSLAISKRYPTLQPLVQEALDAMKEDGTLNRLAQKWGLE